MKLLNKIDDKNSNDDKNAIMIQQFEKIGDFE